MASRDKAMIDSYDLLATAVLLLDDKGEVVHANNSAEELFGLSRRQLKSLSVAVLLVLIPFCKGVFRKPCKGGSGFCGKTARFGHREASRYRSVWPWFRLIINHGRLCWKLGVLINTTRSIARFSLPVS